MKKIIKASSIKPTRLQQPMDPSGCTKTTQQQKSGSKDLFKASRLVSGATEQPAIQAPVAPSSDAAATRERPKHHQHGFKHHGHDRHRNGDQSLSVSFKLQDQSWIKTVVNPRGKTRTQAFADADGDRTFTPVRRDPLTGTSQPHGHAAHHTVQTCSLTFDGTTLVETERIRFGAMVSTFTDANKDGIFTSVSRVFEPCAASSPALGGRLDAGATVPC